MVLMVGNGNAFILDDIEFQKVQTNVGEIHGLLTNVSFDDESYQVRTFLGIPYAKPPTGERRFKKSELLDTLPTSPFIAWRPGNICPQSISMGIPTSEDCLSLNIYAPIISESTSAKAVMVWIHGGGFVFGWSSMSDGGVLSAYNDVIVVTINYRLGPLGFFTTYDDSARGNYGLWDQHVALLWLRQNIAAFGGDPENIVLLGASAGAGGVLCQSLFPGNRGLVRRAIVQSGTITDLDLRYFHEKQNASVNYARHIGCNETDSQKIVECLQSVSEEEIIKSTAEFMQMYLAQPGLINAWAPMQDNDFVYFTPAMLRDSQNLNLSSEFMQAFLSIDLMIGDTNLDGLLFLQDSLNAINSSSGLSDENDFTWEQFYDILPGMAQTFLKDKPTSLTVDAIIQEYTAWDDIEDPTTRLRTLVDITTDYVLNSVVNMAATSHRRGSNATYVYQFATAPPGPSHVPAPLTSETSASHGDDVVYVFGFPFMFSFGPNALNVSTDLMDVSKATMTMWTNFAKTG